MLCDEALKSIRRCLGPAHKNKKHGAHLAKFIVF